MLSYRSKQCNKSLKYSVKFNGCGCGVTFQKGTYDFALVCHWNQCARKCQSFAITFICTVAVLSYSITMMLAC